MTAYVKDYKQVELNIASSIDALKGQQLPSKQFPQWLINIGVKPGATIKSAKDVGDSGPDSKTDVIVELSDSAPLKISVKKDNADYYGNWYGHKKILKIFSKTIFDKLTYATTHWANEIKKDPSWENKPFVGVSICFGKRSGKTKLAFDQVFSTQDILTIAKGKGADTDPNVANALIITDNGKIANVIELIDSLKEISVDNILKGMDDFYIIFRPINPMTEKSNRGKNIYTRFVPDQKLAKLTTITTMSELNKYGTFEQVSPVTQNPMMTHNFVLKDLEENYNIHIPTKEELKNQSMQ